MFTSLRTLIKQIIRTHLDITYVRGGEQGTTSEPRWNYFLLVSEAREVGETRGEAQDTSYTHNMQNPPAWRTNHTRVHHLYHLYWERHLSTFLQTGVSVSRVICKETNARLLSSSVWTSVNHCSSALT